MRGEIRTGCSEALSFIGMPLGIYVAMPIIVIPLLRPSTARDLVIHLLVGEVVDLLVVLVACVKC